MLCGCLLAQSCPTLCDLWTVARQAPVRGILQARVLGWAAISSSRGSFQPRDGAHTVGRFFTVCRARSSAETELEGGC